MKYMAEGSGTLEQLTKVTERRPAVERP